MAHIDASPRIAVSTTNAYLRKRVEPVYRKSVMMGMMKANGRVSFRNSGKMLDWRPRFRRRTIIAGQGNPLSISFPQTTTKKVVTLPWRQYQLGESVSKYERLVGQSRESALFKIAEEAMREMAEDFIEDFRLKLYVDGNATGSKDIHGLESMFSVNSVVSNSRAGNPNDTYAGVSTALGLSGDWDPDTGDGWPTGTGDAEYNWFSPLVGDYTNTGWTGGSTWATAWREAIRYVRGYLMQLQGIEPDVLLLELDLLNQAKQSLDSSERFVATARSGITDAGFSTLKFEDCEIATEYGIPDAVGYFLTWDKMELKSMQEELIVKAQDSDITTATDLISLDFFGNLMLDSPAFFGKLAAIS